MHFYIQKLEKAHAAENFDCGDQVLNTYLQRYALQNQQRHSVGVTYVMVSEESKNAIIGYYTLATAAIQKTSLSKEEGKHLSPYTIIPCIILARLGVDRRFQKQRVGRNLVKDALNRSLLVREEIGCRCVIVDAYPGAVSWYQQFGFISLRGADPKARTQNMLMDLQKVEAAGL